MSIPPDFPGANERYTFDVVVVGGGIAGLAAAMGAAEAGAQVAHIAGTPLQ